MSSLGDGGLSTGRAARWSRSSAAKRLLWIVKKLKKSAGLNSGLIRLWLKGIGAAIDNERRCYGLGYSRFAMRISGLPGPLASGMRPITVKPTRR